MIEKRITQQLLEAGELVLTPTERVELALPEHSTTIKIELEGEVFGTQWSGRTRQLSGDMFTERLQDYGQVGGLVRLRYVDQVYRLLLLPPGSGLQVSRQLSQPAVVHKVAQKSKAARRRATIDRQFHSDDEYDWGSSDPRTIGFLVEARTLFGEQLKAAGFDPLELVELRLQGEELATLDDFEELLAVDVANVDRMPHQEAVARHALSRLRGRAVLADEVGLGKTIEAGLAVKELTLRGLAKRALILCPAPLRDQWREEMHNKFDLPFDVAYRGYDIGTQDKLIVSLTLATREIDKLTKKPWDIVIVDEAHRAAGAGARKRRELITALTTACRYAFFLTATPVQNDLLELYRLVELLRPGTFTSVSAFKREFMTGYDPRKPKDPAALRRLISSAMIRTTRAQAGVDRVVRRAVDVPIELGPRERELYVLSTELLRNIMNSPGDTMRRRSLALRLTASPFSMGTTALRMAERHPDPRVRAALSEVGHLAMDIAGSARENKALDITRGWIIDHGRVLIFTQHTDTVTGLLRRIEAEGLKARSFHGSMSPSERAATIAAFRSGEAPIMISTDAGAEGQNLQFCNCVLNYDLPWNPMRIEQRIGRVDRLTQPRDEVFVANLYA
ncbi:DEAD/DEAH box helicase, partial [Mycobacterium sp.]|uniref:DEAD/DEAH box helicase n=1 Tax=Mycobacterium sp. TaxID=1785 RepID=UPI003BAE779B